MIEERKVALLIDAENISIKYIEAVIKEVAKYGKLIISRYYGDVSKLNKDWVEKAIDYAIKPMHQNHVSSQKNAADMALTLDAVEIMYREIVDTFFIISSDSDFTPLAIKLRENGMHVIGIGNEKKVTKAFKSSCNEFKYFEYLINEENEISNEEESDATDDIENVIKDIIIENSSNGKLLLSTLGTILVNRYSDFDPRKFGAKNLLSLIKTCKGIEVSKEKTTVYVSTGTHNEMENIIKEIYNIISQNQTKKMKISKLIHQLRKKYPDFNYEDYGFTKFSKFLTSIDLLNVKNENVTYKK